MECSEGATGASPPVQVIMVTARWRATESTREREPWSGRAESIAADAVVIVVAAAVGLGRPKPQAGLTHYPASSDKARPAEEGAQRARTPGLQEATGGRRRGQRRSSAAARRPIPRMREKRGVASEKAPARARARAREPEPAPGGRRGLGRGRCQSEKRKRTK